ncbi:MAG: extracellular solute-binding protein [Treponema sp.]|nr:extracellular solute-binding protein [Treponema sp.]
MKRYAVTLLMVLVCAGLVFAGPGQQSSPGGNTVVKVRSGWNQGSLPNWPAAIQAFEASHPGVKIAMEYTPSGEDSMTKLRAEFVAGNPPDVVQAWKTFFNEFVDAGLVEKLNDQYDKYGWKSGVLTDGARSWCAPIADAANANADVYGVADYINTSVFYYNTDVFNSLGLKEPGTLEELVAVARALRAAGKKPMIVTGNDGNLVDLLTKIQAQFTGLQYLLDVNSGKAKLTDASMLRAMKVVERLFNEGVVDKSSMTYKSPDCWAELANGNAGMFSMHTADDRGLRDIQAENPNFHYAIMKGVKFTDNPVTEYSCTYGGNWMIPASSKVKPQAKEFLFYIFGEEVSRGSAASGRITNMLRSNSSIGSQTIQTVVQYQLPKLSYDTFYLIDMVPGSVLNALWSGMQQMLQGTAGAETVLADAQRAMDRIIAER